jgi:hypothetical protein
LHGFARPCLNELFTDGTPRRKIFACRAFSAVAINGEIAPFRIGSRNSIQHVRAAAAACAFFVPQRAPRVPSALTAGRVSGHAEPAEPKE